MKPKITCLVVIFSIVLGSPWFITVESFMGIAAAASAAGTFTIEQTLSDEAQRNTIAFDALAFLTGSLGADSLFPPGKVADFWGFQYLRDNDPTEMGHNTGFLTRAAFNMLYVLTSSQRAELIALATAQVDSINEYAYNRFVLMQAFRRLLEGDLPVGSMGLDRSAVKAYSSELYRLDGQISYERAQVMGGILNVLDTAQKSYLDDMVGAGMLDWPNVEEPLELRGLDHDVKVAVMTYAGDLFSWYAGSVEADVYFCPERQGTYFGSFYLKGAPAMGNPDYTMDPNLTANMGSAFLSTLDASQSDLMTGLVDTQKPYLYEIVDTRGDVSTQLRRFIAGEPVDIDIVLSLMGTYGELDGEIVYNYATNFARVHQSLTGEQQAQLAALRTQVLDDLAPVGAFLYSQSIDMPAIPDTDFLFASAAADGFAVVDTGQTTCYGDGSESACPVAGGAFYGQDAQHAGNQPSYTDNGDGTVTDNVTGLMWQQTPDTDGDGDVDESDKVSWADAQTGAESLTLGGYADWRLPTIKELYSLIDFSGTDPSGYEGTDTSGLTPFIDTAYFDFAYGDTSAGVRIIDAQYRSSTQYVAPSIDGKTFGVNFADGRIKGYPTSFPGGESPRQFVRYVRGNTSYGVNDFVDNGDGTITDSATGLMWAQDDNGTGLNWQQALAWVEAQNAANYLGYSDWRLPNAKELQSIVDYSRSPDTSSSAAIDPLFNATGITNEGGETDYPFYWSGTTHANWTGTPGGSAAYVAFGRALGYMNSTWVDVHGAGAQRSDPKAGDPAAWPYGRGPQGDAIRIYNYVRLVRDAGGNGENIPPTAEAGGPYVVEPDSSITLDGSASTDTDGTIVLYEWNLDNDGEYDDATGTTADFAVGDDGPYIIGLRVTDDDGAQDTDTATVTTAMSACYLPALFK